MTHYLTRFQDYGLLLSRNPAGHPHSVRIPWPLLDVQGSNPHSACLHIFTADLSLQRFEISLYICSASRFESSLLFDFLDHYWKSKGPIPTLHVCTHLQLIYLYKDSKYLCTCVQSSDSNPLTMVRCPRSGLPMTPPHTQYMDSNMSGDYLKTISDYYSCSFSNLKCLDNLNYLMAQILP